MSLSRAMAEPSSPATLGEAFMPVLSSRHEAEPPNLPVERPR
jgi:hypothetical protein